MGAGGGGGGGPGDGTGPGAELAYLAGGAGHPGLPGTAVWTPTLGRYWSHDYAERIVVDPDEDHVWLITKWATFREFTKSSVETVYPTVSPSDEYRTLETTVSGWTLTDLDGTVTEFDSAGLWLSTTDRNGNATTATYTVGQLTSVDFPDGRSEDFTYDGSGKLESITEIGVAGADTRTWTYTWTGDDLVRIDRPDGTAWLFTYGDSALPGYMTLMELEGPDTSTRVERGWEYDAEGNAFRTWSGAASFADPAAVDTWELSFDDPDLPTVTTVTDPMGDVATYTIGRDPVSTKARVESISGGCPGCGLGPDTQLFYEDAANPLRVTREVAADGVETHSSYDSRGRLVTRTEAANTVLDRDTSWGYDPAYPALVIEIERPSIDAVGFRRTLIGRNASGDAETQTVEGSESGAAFSYATTTSFNAAGQPLTVDPPGYGTSDLTSFAYDPSRGDLLALSRTDPLVGTTSFAFDPFNRRTSTTDPNGVVVDSEYDALGRVTRVIQRGASSPSDDLVTEHVYGPYGDLVRTILPAGNLIDYTYDDAGRLVAVERRPDAATPGERTAYTLDAAGNRTREELQRWDGAGWVTESSTDYVYTTRCQLDRIDHPDGTSTEYGYDCLGNLIHVWDAAHPSSAGAPTQIYEYDALDTLIRGRQPWPAWTAGWDDADPANEAVTTYGYDVQDHLVSVVDAEGNETTYFYSDRDLLTQESSPVSGTTTHLYNEHGELVQTTDARAVTVQRTVDELDRVTLIDYPDRALDAVFAYDAAPAVCAGASFPVGRLGSIDRDGESVAYCYDRFGRTTRDGALTYAHDPNGNPTSITYPGGVSAATQYDFADRPTSLTVTTPSGPVPVASGAAYLPSGPLTSLALGNGTSETRTFTSRYFPQSIAWSGPPERTWTLTTDAVGNVNSITRTLACLGDATVSNQTYTTAETVESCAGLTVGPAVTVTSTADVDFRATGRIAFTDGFRVVGGRMTAQAGVTVDPPEPRLFDYQDGPYFLTRGDGPWGERDWTYDRIGNRLTETRDRSGAAQTDTYDYVTNPGSGNTPILDEVTLAPSGTADYAWDFAGNLDTLTRGGNLLDFGFDEASRMAALVRGPDTVAFRYDGRSFLRRAEVDPGTGAIVEPLYDSGGLLHGLLEKDTPAGPERRHTFFYLAGQPVAQLTQDGGGESWQYLTTDHLGTPLLAADESGGMVWAGGFEPFGHDFAEGTASAALASDVLLRFPGQWETQLWADASLGSGGMYYNVHRWYQPGTGRYMRPDPMNEQVDPNRYYYGRSNPLFYTDPLGLLCQLTPQWRACLSRIFGFPVQKIQVHDNSVLPDLLTRGLLFTLPGQIFLPGKCGDFWMNPELVLHEYYHVVDQWGARRMSLGGYLTEGARQWLGGRDPHRNNRFEEEADFFAKTQEQNLRDCLGCTPVPPEPPLFPSNPCPPGSGARTRGLGSACN